MRRGQGTTAALTRGLAAALLVTSACAPPRDAPGSPAPSAPAAAPAQVNGALAAGDSAPAAVLHLEPYVAGAGLLTLPVTVADSAARFLFDTGGGFTVVTPAAAEGIGCEPFGGLTGFRHNGDTVSARRCPAARLEVDGWTAPAAEVAVYDLGALLPAGLPPLGGLVALSTFEGRAITLELGRGRVVVESEASLAGRVTDMVEVPVREGRQAGGAALDVFIAFSAGGGPVWMELDSGNNGPVIISAVAAAQLGLDLSPRQARTVTLHLPGFGPVEVEAVQADIIYDGLLNADFVRQHRITLDLARSRAWIAR